MNQKASDEKAPVRIAITGVGNCASALVQGISHYKGKPGATLDGGMVEDIGGYGPSEIEVVAAFDVDKRKVGKKLKEETFAELNQIYKDDGWINWGDWLGTKTIGPNQR